MAALAAEDAATLPRPRSTMPGTTARRAYSVPIPARGLLLLLRPALDQGETAALRLPLSLNAALDIVLRGLLTYG